MRSIEIQLAEVRQRAERVVHCRQLPFDAKVAEMNVRHDARILRVNAVTAIRPELVLGQIIRAAKRAFPHRSQL